MIQDLDQKNGQIPDGVTISPRGELFGTAFEGGAFGAGTVFQLTRGNGFWGHTTVYQFSGGADGGYPAGGLVIDEAGNLYGTTQSGGPSSYGTVFQVTPSADGSWSQSVLYAFQGASDGCGPGPNLVRDAAGNLYGTALNCGGSSKAGGLIFELSPAGGSWTEKTIHRFSLTGNGLSFPIGPLVVDAQGNVSGSCTYGGEYGSGGIFKLTLNGNGGWIESVLHPFRGGADGAYPLAGLTVDSAGNLYGTASSGGREFGYGVVFKITP